MTIPMLSYQDGPAMMDWLADAFGFTEKARMLDDGRLSHGEMDTGDGRIMLATPTSDYESPNQHRAHCTPADAWMRSPYVIDGVLVHVDDVEAHYARALRAGAIMLSEIEFAPPGRLYRVEDTEGHRWMFLQPR
jgi:uncharacterized glyoxalase superfamily protein PhnB